MGDEFIQAMEECIHSIRSFPGGYRRISENIRQAVMSTRFPFVVVYAVEPGAIHILRVFHAKRNPRTKLAPAVRRMRK